MNNSKIALGMIVKDDSEADNLMRCLNSVAPFVDGIFITVTNEPNQKLQDICRRYGANCSLRSGEFTTSISKKHIRWINKWQGYPATCQEKDKIFNFGQARQASLDSIPDEFQWLFWIDTDDILRQGQNLHLVADQALAAGIESVFLNYIYQAEIENDQIKNILIQHLRERLIRIDGHYRRVYRWEGAIHETLIQQRETSKTQDTRLDVLHLSSLERMTQALERNIKVLELQNYEKEGRDPRYIYYLGKAYYDIHTPEAHRKAEKLVLAYLSPGAHAPNMSGWPEERCQAWEYLSEIYRGREEHNKSFKCLLNALAESPESPSTYYALGLTALFLGKAEQARFWIRLGTNVPMPTSTLVTNPRDYQSRAWEVIYNAALKTNRTDEAFEAARNLKLLFPSDKRINDMWNFAQAVKEEKDITIKFMDLANYLRAKGEIGKLKPLLVAAPQTITQNPIVEKARQQVYPPRTWEKNEIAFYCGPGFTQWNPKTLENPGGAFIGGSEEAIIYLTQELARLGWKVKVYADPGGEKGVYNGVEYLAYYEFNPRDEFNVLVGWRAVNFLDGDYKAKKLYLWLHDVAQDLDYTLARVAKLTKVIPLSEAHRTNLPSIPNEKVMISSNGYFEHYPKIKPQNNPHWCIWTSSYDRGIQHLLEIWPKIREAVPDAQLHIFYGWQLFTNFYQGNPERMAWKRKMDEMMTQPGVTHHGRVSQPEVEKWYKQSGIWAYPTDFFEINCISAIKSQLWGVVPVTMNKAALQTTVQFGKKLDGDIYEPKVKEAYTQALIEALKDEKWQEEERKKMMPWAREKFSWKEVAKKWDQEMK